MQAQLFPSQTGLSLAEVNQRVKTGRVNQFKDVSSKTTWEIFASNFANPAYVLIGLSMLGLVAYGEYADATFIAGVILANLVIGIIQEIIARNSLRKISVIHKEPVVVRRDGLDSEIMPEDIVQDDLLVITTGKYLYVDGELVEAEGLFFDESIVTGESDYIPKHKGASVYSGSFVISGQGVYRALKVGKESFINKITLEAKRYINHLSPLQRHVNRIVIIMTYVTIATIGLLLFANYQYLDMDNGEVTKAAVSTISTLIPQGILLSMTLAFMVGVYSMYRKNILVQKANAIESLANIDVLCMDKTGTLTQNKLVLENFIPLAATTKLPQELAETLVAAFCEATLEKNKTLMAIAQQFPRSKAVLDYEVTRQLPFNSRDKLSGVEIRVGEKTYKLILGAIEVVKSKLASAAERTRLSNLNSDYAALGQRNLGFIFKEIGKKEQAEPWERSESQDYSPLGFVSIKDQLRLGANETLHNFLERGVKPLIISGDSPETIMALVKQLKIDVLNNPITGPELAKLSAGKPFEKLSKKERTNWDEAILGHDIFASVTPEQKVDIVKTLQQFYQGVAMIGDGVNDALAIKQANLGISLAAGANVSRDISDIVLLDNDLRKLSEVIQEGKDIIYNTLRTTKVLVIKNFYSVILIVGTLLLDLHFPFTPRNVVLLSFINANFATIDYLSDKGARYRGINFLRNLLVFVGVGGAISGSLALAMTYYYTKHSDDLLYINSAIISLLVSFGLVNYLIVANNSFNLLKFHFTLKRLLVISATILSFIGFVYIPFLGKFFEMRGLAVETWLWLGVISISYYLTFAIAHFLVVKLVTNKLWK